MRAKPFLLASTLAIVLFVGSVPAKAQFYGGGGYIGIGGPSGFVSIGRGPVVAPAPVVAPVVPYTYVAPAAPVVVVRPAPVIVPQPYGVYRQGWGPYPYGGVYTPRPYGFARRGWW
jgi:hypothetical protein